MLSLFFLKGPDSQPFSVNADDPQKVCMYMYSEAVFVCIVFSDVCAVHKE
jgi:hypothetical protein